MVAGIALAVAGLPVLLVCGGWCLLYAEDTPPGGWEQCVPRLESRRTGQVRPGRAAPKGASANKLSWTIRRDESPAGAAGCDRGATGASAPGGLLLRGRVYPKDRSAELGAFYAELRKWVLKEDEAAVAELAGVSPGHVAEVLAGRKPGYGVLCLLVEYATENRAAGRERVVRSAARRAEQVEELRLDFMCGVAPLRMGSTAREPQNRAGSHEADMRANGQQTGAMGASGRVALLRKGASGGCDPLRKGASAGRLTWNDTAPSLSSGAVLFFCAGRGGLVD